MTTLVSESIDVTPAGRVFPARLIGDPRKRSFRTIKLPRERTAWLETSLMRILSTALLAMVLLSIVAPASADPASVPEGIWLVDPDSALQIFDCTGSLCGRVVWLRHAHDPTGQIQRDKKNPDPAARPGLVCGMTVLWNLRPTGSNKWESGWFYNPDDGDTYSVTAELRSSDVIVARIYKTMPVFGQTKTLLRVPRLSSEGWC